MEEIEGDGREVGERDRVEEWVRVGKGVWVPSPPSLPWGVPVGESVGVEEGDRVGRAVDGAVALGERVGGREN